MIARLPALTLCACLALQVSGCGDDGPCDNPYCAENDGTLSHGGLCGFSIGMPDRHPECRYAYYDGHIGGTGDTLQVTRDDQAVWVLWAFGRLQVVSVRAPWQGTTDRGIGIGDSLDDFLEAYPDARRREACCSAASEQNEEYWSFGRLLANFNSEFRVHAIEINAWDLDDEGDVLPVGPGGSDPW